MSQPLQPVVEATSVSTPPSSTTTATATEHAPGQWTAGTLRYDRRGLASLFGWLLFGDFTWQMRERAVGPTVTLVLKLFGASDSLIGLLVGSVPAALGMLVVPVISTISDNHRGPRGRRIPFLLIPIPFAVVALIAIGFTPELADIAIRALGDHAPDEHFTRIAVFAICWTAFEIAAVVTNAIYTALVNDVVPHPLLGRFLGAFRMVSMGAGVIFNAFLLPYAETHYRAMFIALAVIYAVGMYLVCVSVKEGEYPPPPPIEESGARNRQLSAAKAFFRETFSNRFYLLFYATMVTVSLMQNAGMTFGIFFAKSIGVSLAQYGKLQSAMFFISFSTAYVMGVLNDRFHPLRVMIVTSAAYTLGSIIAGLFATSSLSYGIIMLPTWFAGGGVWAALPATIQRILPRSRFGVYSSALGILTGLVGIFCASAVGVLLDLADHNYRLINYLSGGFGVLAVAMLLVFHAKFMAMGGPERYVAPE